MIKKRILPTTNRFFFFVLLGIFTLVIIFNLFYMQVVLGNEYLFNSKSVYASYKVDRAQRGLIYDRNGIQLVENVPRYKIYINKISSEDEEVKKTIESLSKLSQKNVSEIYAKEFEKVKDYKNINEVKIFNNIEYAPYIFQIEANPENFPQVKIEKYMMRKYLYPELISHIVGYTGEITPEDYETGKFQYGDEIGKYGIEQGYDDILRGQNGLIRIDNYGSSSKTVSSNAVERINGKDLYLTIDIKYQKKIYDLIKLGIEQKRFGEVKSYASVVEDVHNGEILAMASYPNFDANLFVQGISEADFKKYLEDPGKPLTNKATQYSQSPGSTFKTITDLVALDRGAITKDTKFEARGTWDFGGVVFQDYGKKSYGNIDMVKAVCVSSNIYHMKAALALDEKTNGNGDKEMEKVFKEMQLDQVSGTKIGTESIGYFPTREKKEAEGEYWVTGYLLNSAIGQGEVRLSPIGEAKLGSIIANRGQVINQKIIKGQENKVSQLNIKPSAYKDLEEGMKCAAQLNTSYLGIKTDGFPDIALKTGSAETGQFFKGEQIIHGWELSYGPVKSPQISMVTFLENTTGGWRGGYISREFYKYYTEQNP